VTYITAIEADVDLLAKLCEEGFDRKTDGRSTGNAHNVDNGRHPRG